MGDSLELAKGNPCCSKKRGENPEQKFEKRDKPLESTCSRVSAS